MSERSDPRWLNNLRGTVRPVISYLSFALFAWVMVHPVEYAAAESMVAAVGTFTMLFNGIYAVGRAGVQTLLAAKVTKEDHGQRPTQTGPT